MVTSACLLAAGCAPRAKPIGYAGGAVLAIAGTALIADAASTDCTPDEPVPIVGPVQAVGCGMGVLGEGAIGGVIALTGLTILIVALASPGASEPAPAGAPPAPPPAVEEPKPEEQEEPDWPRAMRLVPRPARVGVRLAFD